MNKLISFFCGVVISLMCCFAYYNSILANNLDKDIENEISLLNEKINGINKELAANYNSSIFISLNNQKAIYNELIASLEYKKAQKKYWISTSFKSELCSKNPILSSEVQNDINILKEKIRLSQQESSRYAECLIKSLIDSRITIYEMILSSLEAASFASKNDIYFLISDNRLVQNSYNSQEIAKIDKEIDIINNNIKKDTIESSKYAPCLIKSIIDARIEQNKNALALLNGKRISLKYGISFNINNSSVNNTTDKVNIVQDYEKDKEAL